jgi:GNAT superfamily N-acetyltransferase
MDDVERVTDFLNLCEIDESGKPDYEIDEVRETWAEADLSRNMLLVITPEGDVVGSMEISPERGGVFDAFGYTHPEHRGRGMGRFLVEWSEWRARDEELSDWSPAVRILRNWIATANERAVSLLEGAGYAWFKRFVRMEITLDAEPEPASLPEGVLFREVDIERDLPGIYDVVDESFAEHWSGSPRTFEDWRKTAQGYGFDPVLWTQAFRGDQRVAVAIGQNMSGYGWVKWVGVLKPERGRGLGKALLQQQFRTFWRKGITTVGLGVDTENTTGAIALYTGAGMSVSHSNDAYEKSVMAFAAGR